MALVEDDDVIQAFSADRTDETLSVQVERRRGDHEHVNCRNVWQVVAQEAPPGRGGDFGPPRHPPPHCGLADLDAELEQLPVNSRRTPQRVCSAHAADQITDVRADPGPSRTT